MQSQKLNDNCRIQLKTAVDVTSTDFDIHECIFPHKRVGSFCL